MAADPATPPSRRGLLRRYLPPALFVLLLFALYFRYERPQAPPSGGHRELANFTGEVFGTTFSVKVASDTALSHEEQAGISARIQDELRLVDRLMSTWKEDSELSRLNRAPLGEPMELSGPTLEVLLLAEEVRARSGGAFDVTVGPLVNRWGFGPDGRQREAPSDEELGALLARVGQDKLLVSSDAGTATRLVDGLTIDLSAIAKGYAVDRVSEALLEIGQADHMVEIGGEVRAHGDNARGTAWRIAIERPDVDRRAIYEVIPLHGQAMATSGDYRNWLEVDGQRVSHTIDPRTGRPVEHTLASVTVVHGSCAMADAWATALNVLGPVQGPALAQELQLAAFFIIREDDGFSETATPPMQALLTGGDEPG